LFIIIFQQNTHTPFLQKRDKKHRKGKRLLTYEYSPAQSLVHPIAISTAAAASDDNDAIRTVARDEAVGDAACIVLDYYGEL
jgi:hypothetical protein